MLNYILICMKSFSSCSLCTEQGKLTIFSENSYSSYSALKLTNPERVLAQPQLIHNCYYCNLNTTQGRCVFTPGK